MQYDRDLKQVASVVEKTLAQSPGSRANDRLLLIKTWEAYGLVLTKDQQSAFMKVPSGETITRMRRKLNEQGKYLPDESVTKSRHEKAGAFKQEMIEWPELSAATVNKL